MSQLSVYPYKGFQVTFSNSYEVSVMFGRSNYCQRRFDESVPEGNASSNTFRAHTSEDCEVAVFLDGEFVTRNFDAIKHKVDRQGMAAGWVTPEEVAALMAEVAAHKE